MRDGGTMALRDCQRFNECGANEAIVREKASEVPKVFIL